MTGSERYVQRSQAEMSDRALLLFRALERLREPERSWFGQAIQLLDRWLDARDEDEGPTLSAFRERVEDVVTGVEHGAAPAIVDTVGDDRERLLPFLVAAALVYRFADRKDPELAIRSWLALAPKRLAALPDLRGIREQLGMPPRAWRPSGSGAVSYFERRADFLTWLHAEADKISPGAVDQNELGRAVGLNTHAEDASGKDAAGRALRKQLDRHGVRWAAFARDRRRRFVEQLEATVAEVERYGPAATPKIVATSFRVTEERLRRLLEENGLRDWSAYRARRRRRA